MFTEIKIDSDGPNWIKELTGIQGVNCGWVVGCFFVAWLSINVFVDKLNI